MSAIQLTQSLIELPSLTPNDAGCQLLIANRLAALGFQNEHMRFNEVDNLIATIGDTGPLWLFLGHTDVVPVGDLADWENDPFKPEIRNGYLYGRGASDMKSAIAAMVTACEQHFCATQISQGRFGFLLTSDEEGPGIDGTKRVIETLVKRGISIAGCLVGEPSSTLITGDVIKVGRRGSLSGALTIRGKQGHIAYPKLANNPISLALAALQELNNTNWDAGNAHFPPTQFQISNIHAGVGVTNVIPETIQIDFNLRYSPESTAESLKDKIELLLKKYQLNYALQWTHSAEPFHTPSGSLLNTCIDAVRAIQNLTPALSTSGGTSDGRFIAPYGIDVVELGVPNNTIHQINECVSVEAIEALTSIYAEILKRLFN